MRRNTTLSNVSRSGRVPRAEDGSLGGLTMGRNQAIAILMALPLLFATGGCGGDAGATEATVTIAFEHLANDMPIVLGSETPYTNAAGNEFGTTRLSYFVSALTLTLADGTEVTAPEAHYVDHETDETRTYVLPVAVPAGDLAQISFVMGLGPDFNVTGAFTSPPESLMEWPEMMGGGYHYMKFEGRYIDDSDEPFNFMTHSGGLNETDYSFDVVLDATGRQVTDGATFTLEMNVEQWFADTNTWDLNDYFNETHRGIMGDADAQASLMDNGSTVFSLGAP
jgi:hypothetical protein